MVVPLIISSARRHRISDDDMLHAVRNVVAYEEQGDGLTMFIGPGQDGSLLEVGIVDGAQGPVIVHAMKARPKYQPR